MMTSNEKLTQSVLYIISEIYRVDDLSKIAWECVKRLNEIERDIYGYPDNRRQAKRELRDIADYTKGYL